MSRNEVQSLSEVIRFPMLRVIYFLHYKKQNNAQDTRGVLASQTTPGVIKRYARTRFDRVLI